MTIREKIRALLPSPCAVVGVGISNRPLIDFLLSCGIAVTARDRKDRESLGSLPAELEAKGVRCILGNEYLQDLNEPVIFRTPGLRPDVQELRAAKERGARITSEMELFLSLTPATVLGITGSDGKTTTTTLTGLFLEEELKRRKTGGRVFVGGNIGEPLLPLVEEMTAEDFAVVELSSFQLMTMDRSAHRAALTNLSENHLNWHKGMEEYCRAKTNLFRHAPNAMLVTNADCPDALRYAADCDAPVSLFSAVRSASEFPPHRGDTLCVEDGWIVCISEGTRTPVVRAADILLPGKHNLENYMTAIALTRGLVSPASVQAVATTFKGVRHRLERIRQVEGVTFYNSSIDSSPARTQAALSALEGRLIVICGGSDKGVSFLPLARALQARAAAAVLTGETREKILTALREVGGDLPCFVVPSFEEAVKKARALAREGDAVLLSPACASFDAFRNFEERGDTFRRIVEAF